MKRWNKIYSHLSDRASLLKNELLVLHFAYRDPETGLLPKLLILATLGYALSPVDLIPDFIPVLGYVDDLIIIPALISLSIKLIPHDVLAKAKVKAASESLTLKKRWAAAILFISIWLAVAVFTAMAAIRITGSISG